MAPRTTVITAILFLCATFTSASLAAADDIKDHPSCERCGMNREKHADSRMLIEYEDGRTAAFCSVQCAVKDLRMNSERSVKSIHVADLKTRILLDARQAFWVVGGSRPGIMTRTPKWAFGTKSEAEGFIKNNGGILASWNDVLQTSGEEMHGGMRMNH